MIDTFYAYTAGLIDGEGSIQINPSKNKTASVRAYWNCSLHVASNDIAVLRWLMSEWECGTVNLYESRGTRKDRVNGRWSVYGTEVEFVLVRVLPFMHIKREHALLALEFREMVGFKRGQLNDHASDARATVALRLRDVNAKNSKGPDARPRHLSIVR